MITQGVTIAALFSHGRKWYRPHAKRNPVQGLQLSLIHPARKQAGAEAVKALPFAAPTVGVSPGFRTLAFEALAPALVSPAQLVRNPSFAKTLIGRSGIKFRTIGFPLGYRNQFASLGRMPEAARAALPVIDQRLEWISLEPAPRQAVMVAIKMSKNEEALAALRLPKDAAFESILAASISGSSGHDVR